MQGVGNYGSEPASCDSCARSVTRERHFHECERSGFVAGLGDIGLKHFALVINRPPQIVQLAIDLHVNLIEVSPPMARPAHRAHALAANVAGENRTETVPPEPHGLVAHVNSTLEEQILDVAQRQGKPDVHQHYQADYLR